LGGFDQIATIGVNVDLSEPNPRGRRHWPADCRGRRNAVVIHPLTSAVGYWQTS